MNEQIEGGERTEEESTESAAGNYVIKPYARSVEQRGKSWTNDPANDDAFTQAGEYGFIGKAVSNYTIVFENEEELRDFYRYIRLLKKKYPEVRTIGTRIQKDLLETNIPVLESKFGKPKKVPKKKSPVGHEPREEVEIAEPTDE